MIFLARFRTIEGTSLAPVLVDAETPDAAIARVVDETGETPGELRELPAGLLCCELKLAASMVSPEGHGAHEDDMVDDMVPVLEPFADFADWLDEADEDEVPDDAAATEGGSDDV